MYYWFLIEQTGEFVVRARDAAERTLEVKLTGVTRDKLGKSQNPVNATMQASIAKLNWPGENLSLRFLKDPDIAQIRIRMFDGDNFPQWIEGAFKTLREKGTKVLIIDLRGNGGGDDMYGAMLVSYLTDQPFRYFDHINVKTIEPSFEAHTDWSAERTSQLREKVRPNPAGGYVMWHPGVAEQAPGKVPFLGTVFVLIDGGTFSTAADFCAVTHHLKRATFVGEETGGGYYGNNSGILATVTLAEVQVPSQAPDLRILECGIGIRRTIPRYYPRSCGGD
jgi:C-terminal processing protease CtpA/Prc